MLAMTYNPAYVALPARMPTSPTSTLGFGGDGISIGLRTTWGLVSLLSAVASGYHGYKRYGGNVGWTALWGLGGAVFPIIVPIVALIQGYAKPRHGKGFGRRPRRRYRRPMRHYRRRREM